jgi:hypothetical protein
MQATKCQPLNNEKQRCRNSVVAKTWVRKSNSQKWEMIQFLNLLYGFWQTDFQRCEYFPLKFNLKLWPNNLIKELNIKISTFLFMTVHLLKLLTVWLSKKSSVGVGVGGWTGWTTTAQIATAWIATNRIATAQIATAWIATAQHSL